jgi:hypothetical protein
MEQTEEPDDSYLDRSDMLSTGTPVADTDNDTESLHDASDDTLAKFAPPPVLLQRLKDLLEGRAAAATTDEAPSSGYGMITDCAVLTLKRLNATMQTPILLKMLTKSASSSKVVLLEERALIWRCTVNGFGSRCHLVRGAL